MTDNPLGMTDADNEGYAVSANRTPQDATVVIVGALTGKTYTPDRIAAIRECVSVVEDKARPADCPHCAMALAALRGLEGK